jgi:Flp pilus assembly protein TadD
MNTSEMLERAERLLRSADVAGAGKLAHAVLASQLAQPGALHVLAMIAEREGRLDEAERILTGIVGASPGNGRALDDLIRISHARGDYLRLTEALLARVSLTPDRWELWNDLGAALAHLGRTQDACLAYHRAAIVSPNVGRPLLNIAFLAARQGSWARVEISAARASAIGRDSEEALLALGVACKNLDKPVAAARAFRRALVLAPAVALAWRAVSTDLRSGGVQPRQMAHSRRAYHLAPHDPDVLETFAEACRRVEEAAAACRWARQAIALLPSSPLAINTLSLAHSDLALDVDALHFAWRAAQAAPKRGEVLVNLGVALKSLGQFEAAESKIREGLALQPNDPAAHVSLATTLLVRGRVREGLEQLEWRHSMSRSRYEWLPLKRWHGQRLESGKLFVWGEQGVGDEIMFSQFLPRVRERVADILFECDPRLVSIFRRSFQGIDVIGRDPAGTLPPLAGLDAQISLCSVPHALGVDEETIRSAGPFLVPNQDRARAMAEKLRRLGERPKVGIAWRSLRDPPAYRRVHTRLDEWEPVLQVPDVCFVNLQYGDCEQEIAAVESRLGVAIARPDVDLFNDLEGVLALSSQLDLVIATTTTAYTLAAACGVETWLLMASFDYRSFGMRMEPLTPRCRGFIREIEDAWQVPLESIAKELRRHCGLPGVNSDRPHRPASVGASQRQLSDKTG